MEKTKEELIALISKLVLKANSVAGTPEENAFRNKAAKLMAKNMIHEAELDLDTDSFVMDQFEYYEDRGKVPQWVGYTVSAIANTFDCKTIYRRCDGYYEWDIVGTFNDVEITMYFIDIVTQHVEDACWETWPQKTYRGKREQVGNTAFQVIHQRLYDLKTRVQAEVEKEESSKALIVRKMDAVGETMKAMYPYMIHTKPKKMNTPSRDDIKSHLAGIKAGETAPLNHAIAN